MVIGKLRVKDLPLTYAVTLAEAKEHLRVTGTDDDTYITALIKVAQDMVEQHTRRTLTKTKYELYLDTFPPYIDLATGPVTLIHSVEYMNANSTYVTLDAEKYKEDLKAEPARLYTPDGGNWPTTPKAPNAVRVTFDAGYNADDPVLPTAIKQAMLIIIGRYYEVRQDVVTGTIATKIPLTVEHLLGPYRLLEVC